MDIAIDFDGTCVKHEYPKVGADVPHAVRIMQLLIINGHRLILNTMRPSKNYDTRVSKELDPLGDALVWFNNKGLKLHGVRTNPDQHFWTNSTKTYAQLYIDDAALGCPLCYECSDGNTYEGLSLIPKDVKVVSRPYVDWIRVEQILKLKGII